MTTDLQSELAEVLAWYGNDNAAFAQRAGRFLYQHREQLTAILSKHGGGGEAVGTAIQCGKPQFTVALFDADKVPPGTPLYLAPPPQPASLNEPFGDTEQLPDDAPFPEGWDEGRKYRCVRTGRQPPSEGELLEQLEIAARIHDDMTGKGNAIAATIRHAAATIRRLAASGQGVEGCLSNQPRNPCPRCHHGNAPEAAQCQWCRFRFRLPAAPTQEGK